MFDNNKGIQIDKPAVVGNVNINLASSRGKLPADAQRVLDRIQALLDGHLLNRAQLLKLVPTEWSWNLGTISDSTQLLAALTSDRIRTLAELFGVEPAWLEGQPVPAYRWPIGYKHPQKFVQTLSDWGWLEERDGHWQLRMTALAADYRSDQGDLGSFVIVYSYPLAEWDNGETAIYRHAVFESIMRWGHAQCRMDAKALTRWFSMILNSYAPVQIVPVARKIVEAIGEGTAFPGPHIPWGFAGFDNLEDRVLSQGHPFGPEPFGESPHAIETDERPAVMTYVKELGLAKFRGNRSTTAT